MPPTVTATTQALFDRLPEVLRAADPGTGDTLLRYLSLLADQLDAVTTLIGRIDYVGPGEGGPQDGSGTSDLVDPATADDAWLPWLAQLVGVRREQTPAALRLAIAAAGAGSPVCTVGAIVAAAQTALTGTKYCQVLSAGGWVLTIRTRALETPDPIAVLDAIVAAEAKPAGFTLQQLNYAASWDTLEAAYTTSDAWDATLTWDVIEATGSGAPVTGGPGFGSGPYGSGPFGS